MTDEAELEFARVWRAIPKVVFSWTLTSVEGNARLASGDVGTELGRLHDQVGDGVVGIGGAGLAAEAIEQDLVDEYHLFVNPVVLGRGTPYFPPLPEQLELQLTETAPSAPGSSSSAISAHADAAPTRRGRVGVAGRR